MLASLDMPELGDDFLEQSVRDYRKWWLQGSLDLYLPRSVPEVTWWTYRSTYRPLETNPYAVRRKLVSWPATPLSRSWNGDQLKRVLSTGGCRWIRTALLSIGTAVYGSTESTESAAPLAEKRCISGISCTKAEATAPTAPTAVYESGNKRFRVVNRRMLPRYMVVLLCVDRSKLPRIVAYWILACLDIGPRALRLQLTTEETLQETLQETTQPSVISAVPREQPARRARVTQRGRLGLRVSFQDPGEASTTESHRAPAWL